MRALALASFDVPAAVMDVPEPVAGPGEVLVRVSAASVNAYDLGVAGGFMKDYLPYEFPAVIGNDVAGTIEALGEGVDGFSVGDRVFGTMGSKPAIHDGAFAELANPQAAAIAIAPDGLSDQDAGSLGVAGTTAMSAVEAVAPGEGAQVLVVGATGGVGTFAIQLAALRDAHVIASVRPGDEDFVTDLGAAETVDYTGDLARDDPRALPGRDRRRHRRREPRPARSRRSPRSCGAAVARPRWSAARGSRRRSGRFRCRTPEGILRSCPRWPISSCRGWCESRSAAPTPLADAAQALQDFATGHTLGKLVISMA